MEKKSLNFSWKGKISNLDSERYLPEIVQPFCVFINGAGHTIDNITQRKTITHHYTLLEIKYT